MGCASFLGGLLKGLPFTLGKKDFVFIRSNASPEAAPFWLRLSRNASVCYDSTVGAHFVTQTTHAFLCEFHIYCDVRVRFINAVVDCDDDNFDGGSRRRATQHLHLINNNRTIFLSVEQKRRIKTIRKCFVSFYAEFAEINMELAWRAC